VSGRGRGLSGIRVLGGLDAGSVEGLWLVSFVALVVVDGLELMRLGLSGYA